MADADGRHVSNFDGGSPIIPLRDGRRKRLKEGEKMGREEESRDLFELTAHISGKVGELSGVKLRGRERGATERGRKSSPHPALKRTGRESPNRLRAT